MNKLIGFLFWAAFLASGVWQIEHRPNKQAALAAASPNSGCLTAAQKKAMPHLVARHDMVVNWRIRASDLSQLSSPGAPAPVDFVSNYVVCKVSAGDAVVSSELRLMPEVSPASGKTLYLLALRSGEEESLNAGKHLDLFPGPTAAVSNAEVMAVICDSGCDAALQLLPAEIELLKLSDPIKLKKIIH
jgi:hypothetical protein